MKIRSLPALIFFSLVALKQSNAQLVNEISINDSVDPFVVRWLGILAILGLIVFLKNSVKSKRFR